MTAMNAMWLGGCQTQRPPQLSTVQYCRGQYSQASPSRCWWWILMAWQLLTNGYCVCRGLPRQVHAGAIFATPNTGVARASHTPRSQACAEHVCYCVRRCLPTSSCRLSCRPASAASRLRSRVIQWSFGAGCSTHCTSHSQVKAWTYINTGSALWKPSYRRALQEDGVLRELCCQTPGGFA
jgi:hypothetical protein